MSLDRKLSRRAFLLGSSALFLAAQGCSMTPSKQEPSFSVFNSTIDCYGLVHVERPSVFQRTKESLREIISEGNYDLITVESSLPVDQLREQIHYQKLFVQELAALEGDRLPEGSLLGWRIHIESNTRGLEHVDILYSLAEEYNVPIVSVDPRNVLVQNRSKTNQETLAPTEVRYREQVHLLHNSQDYELLRTSRALGSEVLEIFENNIFVTPLYHEAYQGSTPEELAKRFSFAQSSSLFSSDSQMAQRVMMAISEHKATKVAHFGGAAHFLSSGGSVTFFDYLDGMVTVNRTYLHRFE